MQHSVHDRINIAESFLSHFDGRQIFVSKFDPKDINGYDLSEMDKKPWHYHKNFDEVLEQLVNVNSKDKMRGIFFTVNELDQSKDKTKKRTNKMWIKSRAIWCEDDTIRSDDPNDFITDWPLQPNLIVNTSPGKYHYYWLTECDDSYQWSIVQQKMVSEYGSDNSAKDLARILRVPGFYHLKDPKKPHLINYIKLKNEPYKWQDIVNAFLGKNYVFNKDSNTSQINEKTVEKAKKERVFIKNDPILELLQREKRVKAQIEPGTFDITCPWIKEHTKQEDSGTRYFQANYNGYDQPNFKCNHAHCADRNINDLLDKINFSEKSKIPKYLDKELSIRENFRPKFPIDFMNKWPEPWPMIWENWKRIPRELSQPLLMPTVISLHAHILDSKYKTDWGRRPNLYMLNIAESTANKDTNSKDVLRSISDILIEMGILNTIFDMDLYNSDTNITSDTAFLNAVDRNGGSFFWLNTEATRVFQQINSGGSNSAVMALSDKIIEVVDGHGVTSKSKAEGKVQGCEDPNIQIIFYAQPETIEKYINEEMIDSGFLGRAIITLDDKELLAEKPRMFIRRTSNNRLLDKELAQFYGTIKLNNTIKDVYICNPSEKGMDQLTDWSESIIHPILDAYKDSSPLYKMLSRMGNTAEQLYTIILGICREWDKFKGIAPRTADDVDPDCMFDILEFWTQSKTFVVSEYIAHGTDPIAQTIEKVLYKLIKGNIKVEKRYKQIVEERGIVPRSVLVRNMRNQTKLIRKLNIANEMFIVKVNIVLDTMITNNILKEELHANKQGLLVSKKTKYVGFY